MRKEIGREARDGLRAAYPLGQRLHPAPGRVRDAMVANEWKEEEEAKMLLAKGKAKAAARGLLLVTLLLCLTSGSPARAQATTAPGQTAASPKEPAYVVEYYYKAQWGHADEWLALFKKNHLPVLKALKEEGRIVELEMGRPRYHATEDGRWDFRVTITWKNFAASNDLGTEQTLIRKLFPDQETFKREEQRRFEILLAHWDLPVVEVSL